MRTIGEVARLAGVSVRTLHHYDELGLLTPSGRSESGYRLYGAEDLLRLQEILGWRRLGLPLAEIAAILDDPAHDRAASLREQRRRVRRQIERLSDTAAALDRALAATTQEEETMFQGLEEEAQARWGHTPQWAESQRRTAAYGPQDWERIKQEQAEIRGRFAHAMQAGEDPSEIVERRRAHISRWFYACTPEIHRGLAQLYTADPRFARHWDDEAPGLAVYVSEAIAAAAPAS
jgi:DNA-binding transcriptional MerR regulator